jgi:hypothetical protein
MDDDLVTAAYQQFGAWLEQRRHNIELERTMQRNEPVLTTSTPPTDPSEALRRELQKQRDELARKLGVTK